MVSWIANVLICLGLWHIGNKKRSAFLFSIAGEGLWVASAIHRSLWDLAFICAVFFVLAIRSYVKWGKESA